MKHWIDTERARQLEQAEAFWTETDDAMTRAIIRPQSWRLRLHRASETASKWFLVFSAMFAAGTFIAAMTAPYFGAGQ